MTPPGKPSVRLGAILVRVSLERGSGIATAARKKLKRLFCLENGWLAYAASNLLEEQFGEILVRSGDLAPSDRIEAEREAADRGGKLAPVLLERGFVTREALTAAMERHVSTLLSSCLEWTDETVEFSDGRPNLNGETTVRLAPIAAILNHAARLPASIDAVKKRIGYPNLRLCVPASLERGVGRLELDEAGLELLQRADGSRSIRDLASSSCAGEERALRATWGFVLAGLLEPAKAQAGAQLDVPSDAPLGREEVESLLSRSLDADYYGVLGLPRSASRDRIREAYYSLARRYHPDRFRAGPLQDLVDRIEQYFTKVTEAYNTLGNPERRGEYDRQLATGETETQAAAREATDQARIAKQNFLRGKQLAERKRFAEALTFLENAVRLDATVAAYHVELGLVLTRTARRWDQAEAHLTTAVKLEPTLGPAYLALGNLYRRMGRKADAAEMLREVLRWDPANQEATAMLAEIGDVATEAGGGKILRDLFRG